MERAAMKGRRMRVLMKGQPLLVSLNTLKKNLVKRLLKVRTTCKGESRS